MIQAKRDLNFSTVRTALILFYTVGTIGFLVPSTFDFFKSIISYALIFNFVLLAFFRDHTTDRKQILVFGSIYLLGMLIEVLGVQTKVVFGDYWYGDALGLKVAGTPFLIGLNWLFLVYTTSSLFNRYRLHWLFKVLLSSFTMLLYDFLLEQIAPHLDLWYWKNNVVPFQNYFVWFVVAVLFNLLFVVYKVNTTNKMSKFILMIQSLFFLFIYLRFLMGDSVIN